MAEFPPRQRLRHLADCLLRHLPEQLGCLLQAQRFAQDSEVLQRLAQPAALDAGIAAMSDGEAAWMADELERRWRRIAPLEMEPALVILAEDELWVGDQPRSLEVRVATYAVDDGWQLEWRGPVQPVARPGPGTDAGPEAASTPSPSDDRRWVLSIRPEDAGSTLALCAGVIGRAQQRRQVLVANHRVTVRRPGLCLLDDNRVQVRDQSGAPAAAVEVVVLGAAGSGGSEGSVRMQTDQAGVLQLDGPMVAGTRLLVGGVPMGSPAG